MTDPLRLAGDAAALLEMRGFVACARKKDNRVSLDCWVHHQGKQLGFSFGHEESDINAEALATRVALQVQMHLNQDEAGEGSTVS